MYFLVWVLGFPHRDAQAAVRRAEVGLREHWADLGRWHSGVAFSTLARLAENAESGELARRSARLLPVVTA